LSKEKLALFGGPKVINSPFKKYNSLAQEEIEAANQVVKSGNLSQFIGGWEPDFFGGPKVQEFEKQCAKYFKVKYAVTVNSWTSGLIAAIGAIGIEPGDEVIVPTWTMCACATAILNWNAIPVFADIDPDTYCIDISSIEANITPYTKAIMAVDIFGQSSDMDSIRAIAAKYGLKIISDAAQAPGSFYKERMSGTLADIGGFSLNYHKHIHTGEGGILVTNSDVYAERLQLIRNHAEAVVGPKAIDNLSNMVGYNFRFGEIEAAIGIEQLKKLKNIILSRQSIAEKLTKGINGLRGLITPKVRKDSTHSYYVYAMRLDTDQISISRSRIIQALEAEGLKGLLGGYANIHLLPMYQKKLAYGSKGFPWSSDICKRDVSYKKGICPNAETLHDSTFFRF
jgi:perosamine synthetase